MTKANTVWTWHRRYRAKGMLGLQDQPRSGRPRKATTEYCDLLKEALDTDPAEYGYSFTVWTTERLHNHLEQANGIRLSLGRFARRAKKGAQHADVELLFVDETTLSLNYPIRNAWMKRGQQKTIPTFSGKRAYLRSLALTTIALIVSPASRSNERTARLSLSFLSTCSCIPIQPNPILVMDNASYHYSAPVRAALSLFAHRVHVFWLPQYCPELNLVERFWKHLKQTAWANKLYATIDSLRKNVMEVLRLQNMLGSSQRLMFAKNFR